MKDGKPILFIEAKKLGVAVEEKEKLAQLGKYAFGEDTKYGVITNGASWILVRSFEENTTLSERIVWKVDLENDELPSIVRKLTTISKDNVDNIEELITKVQILDEVWDAILNDPKRLIGALMPTVKTLIQGYPSYQFNDAEIEDLLKERVEEIVPRESDEAIGPGQTEEVISPIGTPTRMKIRGKNFDLNNSFEILVNTANWLIDQGKLRPSDCPVGIGGGKRYLVNREPKHRTGDGFRAPKKLSNGLYIEVHASTAASINYAQRLLEKFFVPGSSLVLEGL